jgi:hypothetical protein
LRTGIPAGHIMLCCTHTHTAPATVHWDESNIHPDPAYLDVLGRRIADAVVLASRRMRPASTWYSKGQVTGISFNRRYWMKDGSLRTTPPFQSPDIVRPAGPMDPELQICAFRDDLGYPLAVLTNFALHPDQVGGNAVSADYEGVLSRLLKNRNGAQSVILCSNGCAGDINHFDMTKPGPQYGFTHAQHSGETLAAEAVRCLDSLDLLGAAPLRAENLPVDVPLRLPGAEEVEWARAYVGKELREFTREGLNIVAADRIMALHKKGKDHVTAEISVIVMGQVAFVGLPGEIFARLGLEIKARSPFAHTMVIELCNDNIGYLPTREVYQEGGYEAESSPFAPGAGELMVDAVLDLLNRLNPSAAAGG